MPLSQIDRWLKFNTVSPTDHTDKTDKNTATENLCTDKTDKNQSEEIFEGFVGDTLADISIKHISSDDTQESNELREIAKKLISFLDRFYNQRKSSLMTLGGLSMEQINRQALVETRLKYEHFIKLSWPA